MSHPLPEFYDDLDASLAEAWRRLVRGATDRRSGFHTVQVATVDADGGPDLRTVVLRGAAPSVREVRFHTDRRAGKSAQIAGDARVMVHAYDSGAKIQVRLSGTARLLTEGPVWDAAWAATADYSRQCYRMTTPSARPLDAADGAVFDAALTADGGDNFAVVLVRVHRLEWLYLAHQGHRRAAFDAAAEWQGRWLAP